MKTHAIAVVVLTAALTSCGRHDHEHDSKGGGHEAKTASASAHPPAGEKRTHYAERTELFVEFPRLVVGEPAPFAAHLTRLPEFQALAAAKVSVVLSGAGQPDESFTTEEPTQPGIFRPEATPRRAGEQRLSIVVQTPHYTDRHDLGSVMVYADRKSADAAPEKAEDGGIVFTKEQQWKIDFATATVSGHPLRDGVPATGILKARPDAEALLTAPAPGQVQSATTFPRLGQAVRKGDLLAYLVPRLGGDVDLASLQSGARKAKVALDLAVRERERVEGLFKDEAVPEKRVEAARAAEESARAELEAAQGRLGQYGGNGGGIPMRAPVSGLIADVRVTPGAFAAEGALLFHIADTRVLWLELRVAESESARLLAPGGAAFRIEGIDRSFEIVTGRNARLIAVGSAVDPATRTVPVVFEYAPGDARLRLGLAVKGLVFVGASRTALAIPAAALVDDAGISTVYVQKGGEAFERRLVRTGARDGDWVEIKEGISPGERVVTRGAYLVKLAASRPAEVGAGHVH